jgi:hypothetical protein
VSAPRRGPLVLLALSLAASPAAADTRDGTAQTLASVERALAEEDWLAARALLEHAAAAEPEDCTVRAWLSWFEIESGHAEKAEALLAAAGCPAEAEDRGRWALLRALASERRGDAPGVRGQLASLSERAPLWPEDRRLARALGFRHRDAYTLPLEVRAEVALGATSNAFATSPTDLAAREAPGSGVARPSLRLRLRAPESGWTPFVELEARGFGISNAEAREVSHADLSVAAGLRLGREGARPTLRYRHDELLLDAVGGRYTAAKEGELEVAPTGALTLIAGGGRRVFFSDPWRTRTEWNLAALAATSVARRPVVLGGALRYYRAERDVHDQLGGTVTVATDVPVGTRLRARLTLSGGLDDFPRSGGVDGLIAFGTSDERRDVTVRLVAGLWRSLADHLALGLSYEFARRWSTADEPGLRYYPYVDHRLLLSLRFGDGGNPWRAHSRAAPDRVALPYRGDLGAGSFLWDEDMRRLLRQEEDLASECCVVR